MGQIRDYHCDCGYHQRLFPGAGRNAVDLRMVRKAFPQQAEWLADHPGSPFLLDNALVACPSCRKLFAISRLRYEMDGESVILFGNCPDCNDSVSLCDDTEHVSCPKCSAQMQYTVAGRWD